MVNINQNIAIKLIFRRKDIFGQEDIFGQKDIFGQQDIVTKNFTYEEGQQLTQV